MFIFYIFYFGTVLLCVDYSEILIEINTDSFKKTFVLIGNFKIMFRKEPFVSLIVIQLLRFHYLTVVGSNFYIPLQVYNSCLGIRSGFIGYDITFVFVLIKNGHFHSFWKMVKRIFCLAVIHYFHGKHFCFYLCRIGIFYQSRIGFSCRIQLFLAQVLNVFHIVVTRPEDKRNSNNMGNIPFQLIKFSTLKPDVVKRQSYIDSVIIFLDQSHIGISALSVFKTYIDIGIITSDRKSKPYICIVSLYSFLIDGQSGIFIIHTRPVSHPFKITRQRIVFRSEESANAHFEIIVVSGVVIIIIIVVFRCLCSGIFGSYKPF